MKYKNLDISKYLHDGFKIVWNGMGAKSNKKNSSEELTEVVKIIYIDPYKLPDNSSKAELIFITHEHYDHSDLDSIKKILKDNTVIIGNSLVRESLSSISPKSFETTTPGDTFSIGGVYVTCLPSYNISKFRSPGVVFHPKANNGIGYLLTFNINNEKEKVSIYHMGDTDFIEDEHVVGDVDILMIPVSGTYVMTAKEALEACNKIMPKIAIPMHHDAGVAGLPDDALYLKQNARCSVEIMRVQS